MTSKEADYIRQWLEKADHDLIAATLLIEQRPLILDIVCFHCQQCVEKYLKAFLISHGWDLIKTHNVNFLLEECGIKDGDFKSIVLKNLNLFTSDIRYPDNFLDPSLSEANEYLAIAENVKILVLKKINLA
jgi:HEPN domain-containing protein